MSEVHWEDLHAYKFLFAKEKEYAIIIAETIETALSLFLEQVDESADWQGNKFSIEIAEDLQEEITIHYCQHLLEGSKKFEDSGIIQIDEGEYELIYQATLENWIKYNSDEMVLVSSVFDTC